MQTEFTISNLVDHRARCKNGQGEKIIRIRGIEPRAAAILYMRGGNVSRFTISDA